MTRALTPRQAVFVREYLVDLNATQAAMRAGYSARTAHVQGPRLLGNVAIRTAIEATNGKRLTRVEVKSDRVLEELARLGFADLRRAFDTDGRLLPPRSWPDDLAAAISSIEVVTTVVPGSRPVAVEHVAKIKLWDKPGALKLLGQHLALFTEKHEHSGPGGGPIPIQAVPIDLSRLSDSELLGLKDLIQKALATPTPEPMAP